MKVIYILNELKFSGAELMYVNAAKHFQLKGCKLYVLATGVKIGEFAKHFEDVGYNIIHLPYPSKFNYFGKLVFILKFIKCLTLNNIEIVHNHRSDTFLTISFCARIKNIKSIHTFHNVYSTNWYSKLYHIIIRKISKSIFNCKFQTISESVFQNELFNFKNKTYKINNWYNDQNFYPASLSEKFEARKVLGIDDKSLVIISIGGCSKIKRHTDVINAVKILKNNNVNLLYLHLGSGEMEIDEKQLVKNLDLENSVRFYGNQVDVRKYLIASDIYVMSSIFEGISITTIEAMACKIPTILYNVPGLRDFNLSGENSVLISENYKVLAQSITDLNIDKIKRETLIKNAFEFVTSNYNITINSNKIYELYIS